MKEGTIPNRCINKDIKLIEAGTRTWDAIYVPQSMGVDQHEHLDISYRQLAHCAGADMVASPDCYYCR